MEPKKIQQNLNQTDCQYISKKRICKKNKFFIIYFYNQL